MTLVDDDFTEVRGVTVPRVDIVDKAANGTPFLLMKSAASDPNNPSLFTAESVQALLTKAGETDMTADTPKPGDWIKKADATPGDLLVVEGGAAAVDASVPGSEAWESTDAATAEQAYSDLHRLKATLELLSDREDMEMVSGEGDPDDGMKAWDLDEAAAAVDFAADVVAVYAASEGVEAAEEAGEITKALAGLPGDAIRTVEMLGKLVKAGRTLSAANEGKLRSASESIQSVLASLPAAPDEITKKEAPVADETIPDTTVRDITKALAEGEVPTTEPATEEVAADVVKNTDTDAALVKAEDASAAAGLQAVFDSTGQLIGVVDPASIQPVAGAGAPAAAADEPAAPAGVGEPTDATGADDALVTKSAQDVDQIVKGAVDEVRAETAELVKSLRDEIDHLKAPAKSKVFTNGADGTVPVTRDGVLLKGTGDATDTDALIKASENATDATARAAADNARKNAAFELLQSSRPQ